MDPNGIMSAAVLNKLKQLANTGAKIIIDKEYARSFNGNKNVTAAPYIDSSFEKLGVKKDVIIENDDHTIAWTHRKTGNSDIYFLSNQLNKEAKVHISFRVKKTEAGIFDAVTGKKISPFIWPDISRMWGEISLAAHQSLFIVFNGRFVENKMITFVPPASAEISMINKNWNLTPDKKFDKEARPILTGDLKSLTVLPDTALKYYSGTVVYKNSFNWTADMKGKRTWIYLDSIYNIATIKINGIDCGTLWTPPYELDITTAIKQGENTIEIEVTNTWHNRLIGDALLPPGKRTTWTNAPFRLKDKPLLPAGIIGEIKVFIR